MNGSRTGVIVTAGLREIQRHPTRRNAGKARPWVGTPGNDTSLVATPSSLPDGAPGPERGKGEQEGGLDDQADRGERHLAGREGRHAEGVLHERGGRARGHQERDRAQRGGEQSERVEDRWQDAEDVEEQTRVRPDRPIVPERRGENVADRGGAEPD